MRRNILLRSVQRLLDEGETLQEATLMWVRHSASYLYGVAAFVAMTVFATAVGFETWLLRLGVGAAGAAIALTATTDYRILALTSKGLVLLRAGRVRQVARSIMERPARTILMEPVGGTLISADWNVDGTVYTVSKSGQLPMERIDRSR